MHVTAVYIHVHVHVQIPPGAAESEPSQVVVLRCLALFIVARLQVFNHVHVQHPAVLDY